jgi:hypothetical protein
MGLWPLLVIQNLASTCIIFEKYATLMSCTHVKQQITSLFWEIIMTTLCCLTPNMNMSEEELKARVKRAGRARADHGLQPQQFPPSSVAQEICIWQMMIFLAAKKKVLWKRKVEKETRKQRMCRRKSSNLSFLWCLVWRKKNPPPNLMNSLLRRTQKWTTTKSSLR